MDAALTVGVLARQAGVTPKTVRYYEAIGLLPPATRGPNGYRRYRTEDVHRLNFIQRAKTLGLTLKEVRELLTVAEDGCCDMTQAELREILERKIADCTRRIESIASFRDTLETAIQRLVIPKAPENSTCCPGCTAFAPNCTCVPDVQGTALDIVVRGKV